MFAGTCVASRHSDPQASRAGGGFGGQLLGPAAEPGTYVVKLSVAGTELVRPLAIEADEGPER